MFFTTEPIEIKLGNDGALSMSILVKNPTSNNAVDEMFDILAEDLQIKVGKVIVSDRLYFTKEKNRLIATDTSSLVKKNKGANISTLFLVPAILLDKELISPEQKDMLFAYIEDNPVMKLKNKPLPERQEQLETLKSASNQYFKRNKSF